MTGCERAVIPPHAGIAVRCESLPCAECGRCRGLLVVLATRAWSMPWAHKQCAGPQGVRR
eukprot:5078643-Prymnesium_polylepis.1